MKNIRKWFENNSEKYNIIEYDGNLEANTSTIIYSVVRPHDGTNGMWMVRASTVSAFDRWSNSTAFEAFFETEDDVYNYLSNHQVDIYKQLIEYLSLEYEEATL